MESRLPSSGAPGSFFWAGGHIVWCGSTIASWAVTAWKRLGLKIYLYLVTSKSTKGSLVLLKRPYTVVFLNLLFFCSISSTMKAECSCTLYITFRFFGGSFIEYIHNGYVSSNDFCILFFCFGGPAHLPLNSSLADRWLWIVNLKGASKMFETALALY